MPSHDSVQISNSARYNREYRALPATLQHSLYDGALQLLPRGFVMRQHPLTSARFLLATLLLNLSLSAQAASDLSCTITGVSEVSPEGSLEPLAGQKNYYETAAGAEFIVQRDKGLMMGRFVSNVGWKVSVLDPGAAQNSYKVIATRQSGRVQSQFFEVRLQEKGEKKPFVLVAAEILHGYCKM
jgi:hypothetical protein